MQVVINGVTQDKVAKAMAEIAKAGGQVRGINFAVPTPLGQVVGYYNLVGTELTITITNKPFLVPAGTLESKLREFFA